MKPVVVGISGASGSVIAEHLVEALLTREIPTALVCTNAAKMVWQEEMPEPFGSYLSAWRESPFFRSYGINEMNAPIASGTYPTSGMVIVPCSMASVASLANGARANYLPPAAAYGSGHYPDTIAVLAKGALETIIDQAGNQIEEWVRSGSC